MSRQESLSRVLESDQRIALVVQGGGMRATYSIAALVPFANAGYAQRFDDVYGTSAGAMNGAYFMAKQAEPGVGIYLDYLTTKRFVNKIRIKRVIDIDYLVDDVLRRAVPLDTEALSTAKTQLHVGATSVTSGKLVWFDEAPDWPLFEILRATAALPVIFGREIAIGDDRYVDGGLNLPVPVDRAMADGHKNIVVVLTRPMSYRLGPPSLPLLVTMKALAHLQGHSKAVIAALGSQGDHFNQTADLIEAAGLGEGHVRIWCIAPTAPIAKRLTIDRQVLLETADVARADASRLLRGAA